MKFVFCYDISDQKRLGKIARKMEKHGVRVQYSIFEVDTSFQKAKQILEELKDLMDENEDRVYLFPIEEEDYLKVSRIGKTKNTRVL